MKEKIKKIQEYLFAYDKVLGLNENVLISQHNEEAACYANLELISGGNRQ